MILKDHINMPGFSGVNPLTGPNDTRFGPRFFPVTGCYTPCWRRLAREVAQEMDIAGDVHEGVYAMVGGPTFETVAEIKLLSLFGVDCIGRQYLAVAMSYSDMSRVSGMSTIPEVIVATHCGMTVLAMSLVTNLTSSEYSEEVRDYSVHE